MDTRTIKEQLRSSVEMKRIRSQALGAFLGVGLTFVLALFWHRQPGPGYWAVLLWSAMAILVPVALVALWEMTRILRRSEAYFLCRATLDQPHITAWKAHHVYYTLTLEDPVYGCKYHVKTRSIFQRRGFIGLLEVEYTGRNVTVAYNRATETVVVIG